MKLAPEVYAVLCELSNTGWSGRLTLNFKDGRVLEYEQVIKTRLRETDPSRASIAGGSGGRHT